jgi:hypothetical protein
MGSCGVAVSATARELPGTAVVQALVAVMSGNPELVWRYFTLKALFEKQILFHFDMYLLLYFFDLIFFKHRAF